MAIKTFTTGEVLTAADTNTYLANSGLVYIKSQTVGSGVSSVTVSNAFSATYDNYLVQYVGGTHSTDVDLRLQLSGATGSDYQSGILYVAWGAFTPNAASTTTTQFVWAGSASTNSSVMSAILLNPFLSKITYFTNGSWDFASGIGFASGKHTLSTSYTGFVVFGGSGTMTGGTINVYGYRKG